MHVPHSSSESAGRQVEPRMGRVLPGGAGVCSSAEGVSMVVADVLRNLLRTLAEEEGESAR